MNKKLSTALIIVVAIGAGIVWLFLLHTRQRPVPLTQQQNNPSSTLTQISSVVDVFGQPIGVSGKSFTNTSTKTIVSFGKDVKDDGSASGYVDVYINGKAVGTAQSDLQSLFSFSPDNKYFGFRTYHSTGFGSFDDGLTVMNLVSSAAIEISSPHAQQGGNDFIESYSWDGDTIDVVSYLVNGKYDESANKLIYYRAVPKELWRYDLIKKLYTFIQDLPETSSTTP